MEGMRKLIITYNGRSQTAKEWEKETGIPERVIVDRYRDNWDTKRILTQPVQSRMNRRYEWEGVMRTIPELAKIHGGVTASTMRQRLEKYTVAEAMAMPNTRPHRKTRITEEKQKIMFQPIQQKVDTTQCRTCQYRSKDLTCSYADITGHCRKFISPPSPNCIVYIKGKSLAKTAALKRRGKMLA